MTLSRLRLSSIGLDVGDRWIKAVQLARTGPSRPWRIAAAVRFRRRGPALDGDEIERLEGVLHRRGFTGRRVVVAAPPRSLTCAAITMPPASSGAPLDQIAKAELARIARREPSAVEVGWWPVPAPAGGRQHESTHAMAAACARAEVESLVARFDAGGLEVEAMDAPAWALARAARAMLHADGLRPELCAVLDLGHTLANLVVLRDGVPVYERQLEDMGVAALENELRKAQGVGEEVVAHLIERIGAAGPARAVAASSAPESAALQDTVEDDEGFGAVGEYLARVGREVAASVAYLAHRYPAWPVESIICAGGGSLIPGACERLARESGVPARAATLAGLARPESSQPADDAGLFFAAGLALYAPQEAE